MDERIALALKSEKISDIPVEILVRQVTGLLSSVYMMTGFSAPNPNDLGAMAAKITSDLKQFHAGLSIKELSVCFECGSKDEYGEFMGINVRTITKWIKAYKTSEKRYKTIVALDKTKQALPAPGKEYGEQKMKEMAVRYFEDYKRSGDPGFACVTVYQFLQSIGVINHSPEVKITALKKAKSMLLISKNSLAMPSDVLEFRAKSEAQKGLLCSFFEELINMGIDLHEMFNQQQAV